MRTRRYQGFGAGLLPASPLMSGPVASPVSARLPTETFKLIPIQVSPVMTLAAPVAIAAPAAPTGAILGTLANKAAQSSPPPATASTAAAAPRGQAPAGGGGASFPAQEEQAATATQPAVVTPDGDVVVPKASNAAMLGGAAVLLGALILLKKKSSPSLGRYKRRRR